MNHPLSIVRRDIARTCVGAFIVAMPVAIISSAAHGQGTSGTVPDPISSRDLAGYAHRLDLSDEQRRDIEPFHERYRGQFRQLREGEIEELMQQTGRRWFGGFRTLDRAAIEDSVKKLKQVMARITMLDDGLFSELQTVLSDDQEAALPRVMQTRQRQRYSSGATRLIGYANRSARVDLSLFYDELELTAQQREATEPFIVQYEGRLTAAAKRLYDTTTAMFLDVFDALEEQGVSFDSPPDGAARGQMMQTMMTVWAEVSKKPRDKASAISDLNRRTLREVTQLLEREVAATLRDRFLTRAYPEVPRSRQGAAEHSYQAALRLEGLSKAIREDTEAAASEFRGNRDKLIDEMLDYIDEYRGSFSAFDFRRGNRQEHQDKLKTFRQQLAKLDESAVEALHALLGPDQAGRVNTAVARRQTLEIDDASGPVAAMAGGGGPIAERFGRSGDADNAGFGPDPYLPQPISRRDVALYSQRLELTENDRFILESMHADYLTSYSQISNTDVRALQVARANLRRPESPQDASNRPTAEQIDEVYNLRTRALNAIRDLEQVFFDDIETLIASQEQLPTARRLRLARERAVFNRGISAGDGGFTPFTGRRSRRGRSFMPDFGRQSREARVDLTTVVDALNLSDDDRAKLDEPLLDYETNVTDAFRQHYEHTIRLNREREKMTLQMPRPRSEGEGGDGTARRSAWQSYRLVMEDYGGKAREAGAAIVELNRATLSSLSEALDGEHVAALHSAYNRKAFPSVYDDSQAAERYLTTALKLPNIEDDQGTKISAIIQEFRPAYEDLSNQMAHIHAESRLGETGFDRSRWRDYQQRRNQLDVLRFDRDEVNAKALRRLAEVLTEQQEAAIGLPDEQIPAKDREV